MLGLPQKTELNRQLPKKAIYAKFQMNSSAREKIDADISRIVIVNELSPSRLQIEEGAEVKSFYVLDVILKRKDFDEKNIITISKTIPQNMLMILEYDGEARLAVYRSKLLMTKWQSLDTMSIELRGLNLDKIWENIIVQIGEVQISSGKTLDEQIEIDTEKQRLIKQIEALDRKARTEKQPKKKFEYAAQAKKLREQLALIEE